MSEHAGTQPAEPDLEQFVTRAVFGDKDALEHLVEAVYRPIYNLALRMLRYPHTAEDATQEIVVKIVTHLSAFRFESAFMTWAFKIAANHLLSTQKKNAAAATLGFDEVASRLHFSLAVYDETPEKLYEDKMLTEEVKRSCTLGMLMALSEKQRMALILAEVYELDGHKAAHIMETSPQAYRQQLSRARKDLVGFMTAHCGLANPKKPCRCHKHVANKVDAGQLDPENLLYANRGSPTLQPLPDEEGVGVYKTRLQHHRRAAALLRSQPDYEGNPAQLAEILKAFSRTNSPLG